MLDSQLISNDFIKVKNNEWVEYIKKTELGFNRVTPVINQYSNIFFVSFGFAIRINVISEIIATINNISDEFKADYTTIGGGFQHLIKFEDSRIQVESIEELETALKIFEGVLENEAKLFFDKYKTVQDIDVELNREDRPKDFLSDFHMVALTSAVLNKNPKAKYWEEFYREKIKNYNQHIKNQYEKLVVYLTDNYVQTT
jgi:hypothetical protein